MALDMAEIQATPPTGTEKLLFQLQSEMAKVKKRAISDANAFDDKQLICELTQRIAILEVFFEHLAETVAEQALSITGLTEELTALKEQISSVNSSEK